MKDKIKAIEKAIEASTISTAEALEAFRIKYLGSKNEIKDLFSDFKNVAAEDRKEVGAQLNALKNLAKEKFDAAIDTLHQTQSSNKSLVDLSMPGDAYPSGSRHPLAMVKKEIIEIFERIGFTVAYGPIIEDDWHNFSALNFPEEHPARDMQDTFFVSDEYALRTHTSSVQVRVMETDKPPIRKLMPGRVFRNEAISARAHCIFHQIEGLYIDKGVSFADMKQTLLHFAKEFFGAKTKIRLRPSYFPFTEPSAEMDIYWGLNNEVDYRITKGTGWLEIMGCGMVDPNVLEVNNIDPNIYSGFAFGMGIERIALHKYQIPDLRLFFENDLRFLRQFAADF